MPPVAIRNLETLDSETDVLPLRHHAPPAFTLSMLLFKFYVSLDENSLLLAVIRRGHVVIT